MEAKNLSVNTGYVTRETAPQILAKARAQALALASRLPPDALDESTKALVESAAKVDTSSTTQDEKSTDEEEEDKKSEEDAATGLASLFG